MRAVPAVLLLLAGLAFAAPADASLFNLSTDSRAERPDVAVDDAGTAHVVWNLSAGVPGDDQLVYCRVPRGAKACAATQAFTLPRTDVGGPKAVIGSNGEVILATARIAFPGTKVFALTSTDGGAGFGPPHVVSERFYGAGQEVAFGPGDFSLSLAGGFGGGNEGVIYQSAALDGTAGGAADLTGGDWTKAFDVSVGFPNPVTPLVAYSGGPADQPNRMYFRLWSGAGDYNDVAAWNPETAIPGTGSETKLASGVRGVYLIFRGQEPPYQYFVRRYAGGNFAKDTQTVVSDPRSGDSAIFRDFFEDGDGNLHAVFRQDSRRNVDGLRHRSSGDGAKSWDPIETLASGKAVEDLFNLRVGAAPDGGGAVVGDHNGEGPVWLAPFGPRKPGAGGAACKPSVKLGKALVRATSGCFKRHGGKWIATGAVKVNGVDVEPLGGGGKASASAAFRAIARPGPRTLTTTAPARVLVGNTVLEQGPVAWKLPPGDGKVVRIGSPDGSVFRDLGKFAKQLFEFPVDGDAELLIAGKGTKVPAQLRMPGLIGGMTGATTLRTNQQGQVLTGMKIDVPSAAIGLLRIAGIDVTYDGEDRFTGKATVKLPPAYSDPVKVLFAFEDGELTRLEVDPAIQFDLPGPLPIVGSSPAPFVGLDSIGFTYLRQPGSRLFQGNLLLIAGPKLFGSQIADLLGTVALKFPDDGATTLSANGVLRIAKISLANAHAGYAVGGSIGVPGALEFGGGYEIGPFSGVVDGSMDLTDGSFSASGGASLGPLLGGKAVITDGGMSICLVDPLGGEHGLGWSWKEAGPTFGCPGTGAGASSAAASAAGASASAIKASVAGKGRRRALRFQVPPAAGQVVAFAEEAERVYREIGTTRKARGALRFRPAPGPKGKRRIVAIVEQGGVPVEKVTVARYKAPPAPRPGRPRRATLKRRGGKLVVGWTRVKGARGYEVRVNLPRAGRRLLFFPAAGKRGLRVRGLERSDRATVSVAALGPDLRPGREARAKLKPSKRKAGKRGGRRR